VTKYKPLRDLHKIHHHLIPIIMVKKNVKPIVVKPALVKTLKEKLMAAVQKVLNETEAELTVKIQKVVNKAIKKIVKKTDQQIKKTLKTT